MRKDVIYIDVEDDITAIIDKLKNSSEKIIALVPPKGNPVLQSTVNLKLLNRAAKNSDKQPVIVTNNNALLALAGGMGMYVAKNLQSKPYVPTDVELAAENDAIDVNDTVGAAAAGAAVVGTKVALSNKDDSDELEVDADELAADLENDGDVPGAEPAKKSKDAKKKSTKKVPNFNDLKKKMLIFGALAAVLLVVLIFFIGRPSAKIVVRAETTQVDIEYDAKVDSKGASDPQNYIFRPEVQESQKTVTQDFTPTGKKDVGEKATGTVRFTTDSISALGTIPSGTQLTSSGGLSYITTQSATLTIANAVSGVDASVKATSSGSKYNGASGSLSGAPSGVSATFSTSTSGGTDKTVKVVSQADMDKATADLKSKDNGDVQKELEDGFGDNVKVLPDSFSATVGKVTSEPAVGQEANEGKLTAQVTYSMLGIKKEDLKVANEAAITKQMDNKAQQQVYKDGVDDSQFTKIKLEGTSGSYTVKSVGQYGPKFDTAALAEAVANKKSGEVRSYIQDLPGVKSMDISISPFWSRSTPGANKIEIKLEVEENTTN